RVKESTRKSGRCRQSVGGAPTGRARRAGTKYINFQNVNNYSHNKNILKTTTLRTTNYLNYSLSQFETKLVSAHYGDDARLAAYEASSRTEPRPGGRAPARRRGVLQHNDFA
ncbi:jg22355, partial [Pararge aegeria aegeria]